jgi:hypothetical protein
LERKSQPFTSKVSHRPIFFRNPHFPFFSKEPLEKVLEWFDAQVSMGGLFPLLRLKPSDAPPPFVIPAKTGIQRKANGETAAKLRGEMQSTGSFRIWVPAFAGMTKSGIALRPECKEIIQNNPSTLAPFTPYFCERLEGKFVSLCFPFWQRR